MCSRDVRGERVGTEPPTGGGDVRRRRSESRLIRALTLTVAVAGVTVLAACSFAGCQAQSAEAVTGVLFAAFESADSAGASELLDDPALLDDAEGDSVSKFKPDRIKCDQRRPHICQNWDEDSERTPEDGEPAAGTQRWHTQVACPQFSASSRRIEVVNLTSVLLVLKAGISTASIGPVARTLPS